MEDISVTLRYLSGKTSKHTFAGDQKIADLRAAAAEESSLVSFKLVLKGKTLEENSLDLSRVLKTNDVILVAPVRKIPDQTIVKELVAAEGGTFGVHDDNESDAYMARPPPGLSPIQRRVGRWLKDDMNAPQSLMIWFYMTKPWMWLALVVWTAVAPLAARYASGSLYVLISVLLLMVCNLGNKKEGESSAYSVFNPNAEALPGQMGEEHVEGAIRGAVAPVLF